MTEPESGRTRRSRTLAIVAAALIVVVIAAVVGVVLIASDDDAPNADEAIRDTVENFYTYTQDGDLDKAKSVVCDQIVQTRFKTITAAQYTAKHKLEVAEFGRFEIDSIDETTVSGDRATVTYTGHSSGGTTEDIGAQRYTAGLRDVDGDWRICKFPAADADTQEKMRIADDKSEVRAAIERYYAVVDEGNREDVLLATCAELQNALASMTDADWQQMIDPANVATIESIDDIQLAGESAKVTLTERTPQGATVVTWTIIRELTLWKPCRIQIVSG